MKKASISIYSLYHFWKRPVFIDIVLIVFFGVSLFFAVKQTDINKPFDVSGFWINLAASFLSIWITVRLVDNLIKKREKLKNARQILVSNIKHPIEYVNRFYPRLNERDVTYLQRELNWFEKKWGNSFYLKILKENEEEYVRKLVGLNRQLVDDVEHLVIGQQISINDEKQKQNDTNSRLLRLKNKMAETEIEIENLVMEIWKTDRPISL